MTLLKHPILLKGLKILMLLLTKDMTQKPSLNKLRNSIARPLFLPGLTGKIQENTINIFIRRGILLSVSLIRSNTSEGYFHDLIKKLPLLWAS